MIIRFRNSSICQLNKDEAIKKPSTYTIQKLASQRLSDKLLGGGGVVTITKNNTPVVELREIEELFSNSNPQPDVNNPD